MSGVWLTYSDEADGDRVFDTAVHESELEALRWAVERRQKVSWLPYGRSLWEELQAPLQDVTVLD